MRKLGMLCFIFIIGTSHLVEARAATNFALSYRQGRVLLKRGFYSDAIKEFRKVVFDTAKGKTHFASHFFLARSYLNVGKIPQALKIIDRAKPLIKNSEQRTSLNSLSLRIKTLFGKIQITPEADPDEIGRLRLSLKPTSPFSNLQKSRIFRILSKRWKDKGIALNTQTFYLPKAEYTFKVALPQCLTYGVTKGSALVKTLTVGDAIVGLAIKEQASCKCPGGQIVKQEGKRRFCGCPDGSVWSQKGKRCVLPGKGKPGWFARNWPWVTVVGVGVVAASIAVPVTLTNLQNRKVNVTIQGKEPNSLPKLFAPSSK